MFINKTRNILDLNSFQNAAKAITPKILSVLKFGDDNLRFELLEALSAQEDSDLDDLIANFVDTDLSQKVPKIIGLAKPEAKAKDFSTIIYTSTFDLVEPLHPVRTVIKGEVQNVKWFSRVDPLTMTPSNLVLEVDIAYERFENGLAIYRDVTRTHYNEDGSTTVIPTKRKYYTLNPSDAIDEGIKRRRLLVKSLQIPVLTAISQVLMPLGYSETICLLRGRAFMDEYEDEFNKFVDNSSTVTNPADPDFEKKSIVVKVRDEANTDYVEWLDKAPPIFGGGTTIRQHIMNEFDI